MLPAIRSLALRLAALALAIGLAGPALAAQGGDRDLEFLEGVTWGATRGSLGELRQLGRERWLDRQLSMSGAPLPALVQQKIDAMRVTNTSPQAAWTEFNKQRDDLKGLSVDDRVKASRELQLRTNELVHETVSRSLLRSIHGPEQLRDRLTWFWVNHFSVNGWNTSIRLMVGDYEERAIRLHSLGRFRDLLGAATRHPAMLQFLDNTTNIAGRRNENHARELLELHTMGVGSGYTQHDVEELARVMTGFRVEVVHDPSKVKPELRSQYATDGLFVFNPALHDYGDKVVLGHAIKGSGQAELEGVLDMLARHPATARYVSRKLATYFMTDDPPQKLVEAMSQEFLRSDGSIPAVLKVLFLSPDFDAALGRRTKDPLRYLVSTIRYAYEGETVLSVAPLVTWLNRLAFLPYRRTTPDGYPLTSDGWTGSGQMAMRFDFARSVAWGTLQVGGGAETPEASGATPAAAAARHPPPRLRNALYEEAWKQRLAPHTISALGKAANPKDWGMLFLASPEFMEGGAQR